MNEILQQRIEEAARHYLLHEHVSPLNDVMHQADLKAEMQYHRDIERAYIEGGKNSLQNQWISVEEALPESIVQRVLVVNHHFPFDVCFGRYEYGKWIIEGESENLWITHWMFIPSLEGGGE